MSPLRISKRRDGVTSPIVSIKQAARDKQGACVMSGKVYLAVSAISIAVGLSGQPAWSQETGVKAGVLTCDVASGWGFVFGSTRDLKCNYEDNDGSVEHYAGHIDKFGVDIGYHAGGVMAWAVLAPTTNVAKGALAGEYGGVTAGAVAGVGAGANLLIGGSDQTISMQPLSVEGATGINVAAGVARIVLTRPDA
jgi:hypothetical protein